MNKYRVESTRLRNWNYAWHGAYFITICTANRIHYFGKIDNNRMMLTQIGEIAEKEWMRTPNIRPDMNISIDAFCVMPNHLHGIVIIGENEYNRRSRNAMNGVSTSADPGAPALMDHDISALAAHDADTVMVHCASMRKRIRNQFRPQCKNLASIIRGFKSSVTMHARRHGIEFAWQTRYYDRIIHDNESLSKIRWYIINNPLHWRDDALYNR